MSIATLTSKGQLTIPKDIREFLHLHPGDRLDFVIENENKVVLRPATINFRQLKGMLKKTDDKIVSIEEMNEAIAKGAIGEEE